MSSFISLVDFSRQIKQYPNTIGTLSGSVNILQYNTLGTDYVDLLPLSADTSSTGVTSTFGPIFHTFTGDTGTTTFYFSDSNMDIASSELSAITIYNSGVTQYAFTLVPTTSITVDGNLFNVYFSGVSFDLGVSTMTEYSPGLYSGTCATLTLDYLSASTYPWWFINSGSTTWLEVKGRSKTDRLTVTDGAVAGYVLTALDSDGNTAWLPSSGSTSGITTQSPYKFGNQSYDILPVSGNNQTISSENSLILNGLNNVISASTLSYTGNTIINGESNYITNNTNSSIINGFNNKIIDGLNNVSIIGLNNFTAETSNTTFIDSINVQGDLTMCSGGTAYIPTISGCSPVTVQGHLTVNNYNTYGPIRPNYISEVITSASTGWSGGTASSGNYSGITILSGWVVENIQYYKKVVDSGTVSKVKMILPGIWNYSALDYTLPINILDLSVYHVNPQERFCHYFSADTTLYIQHQNSGGVNTGVTDGEFRILITYWDGSEIF